MTQFKVKGKILSINPTMFGKSIELLSTNKVFHLCEVSTDCIISNSYNGHLNLTRGDSIEIIVMKDLNMYGIEIFNIVKIKKYKNKNWKAKIQ